MARAAAPLAAALLGLAGSLAATHALYRAATAAVDRVLEERLRGAGVTAARAARRRRPDRRPPARIMDANRLDGAYVVSPALVVVADATGPSGGRVDLLRVDAERVQRGARGRGDRRAAAYDVGDAPGRDRLLPDPAGRTGARRCSRSRRARRSPRRATGLRRALGVGVVLAALGAVALAVLAAR